MSKTSIILSVLMVGCFTLLMAPGIFAMNRGKTLRNLALWLGIFAGLGLIYKNFGPESDHPLFSLPARIAMRQQHDTSATPADKTDDGKANGSQGFTPPGE